MQLIKGKVYLKYFFIKLKQFYFSLLIKNKVCLKYIKKTGIGDKQEYGI